MTDITEETAPLKHVYAGYDPAKVADGSGFILVEREDKLHTVKMIKNFRGVDYTDQVKEISRICRDHNVVRIALDSNGVGDAVHDQLVKELGGRVMAVPLRKANKEAITMKLRILFQDQLIVLGRNFPYFLLLRKELHELDPKKLDHPVKGSSDLYWALALACHAAEFNYIKAKRFFWPGMER